MAAVMCGDRWRGIRYNETIYIVTLWGIHISAY